MELQLKKVRNYEFVTFDTCQIIVQICMSVWHNEKVKYLPRNIRTPSPPPYWNEHMNTSVHYPLSRSTILSNFMKKDLNYFVR